MTRCHAGRHERLGPRRQGARIKPGLPVVFSSGCALEMLTSEGRTPGKSIILSKPYRKAELAERLREALVGNFVGQ
jgi:hypothetical protein